MKLSFLGDVFLDKPYEVDIALEDFIFNLEFPLSKSGPPAKGKINLGMDKSYIFETFKKYPIAVNLANNHIMDYGEEAFNETLAYLDDRNISYFGAGNEANNFNNPCIINFGETKIALLGYSCATTNGVFGGKDAIGSALLKKEKVIEDIREAKKRADKTIVNFHWGEEHISVPKPSDVAIAKEIINEGADLIIGHHAHVVQSIQTYKGRYIFYGLGNFIFPDIELLGYHNGKKFTKMHKVNWLPKHMEALIVDIHEDFSINYRTAKFDGKKIYEKRLRVPKWIPGSDPTYRLFCSYSMRKDTISRFLKEPKIPSIRQVKLFLGIKE